MKAISCSRYGGPGVLEYGDVRDPRVRPDADDLLRLSELAERGVVGVHVSEIFPLAREAEAHRLNEEGRTRGEIVVTADREP